MGWGGVGVELLKAGEVQQQLSSWIGKTVHVHLEVNPGAYWRNAAATLRNVHVKGTDHYRIYLEFDGNSIIHIDDLTHMQIEPTMVICTGYDSSDRIARTLEVSTNPFRM